MEKANNKTKILLVEDDASMGFLVKDYLEMTGFEVRLLADGDAVIPVFVKEKFHLCILDIMLPQKDGFAIATDIRRYDAHIPIIFLTAKNMKEDRIKGFKIGGDDYVTKPFSIEELHLRIEAVLKRSYAFSTREEDKLTIHFGNSTFDTVNQCLSTNDVRTELTYREAKLLKLFCHNKNKLLERDFITKAVWEDEGILVVRSLDVFVSRLRKLLKDNPSVKISNIHGVGYRFEIAAD